MEGWVFGSCEPWQMGLTQNFNLNMTVLVFAPGFLSRNVWRVNRLQRRLRRKQDGRCKMASILPFIRKAGAVFDDRVTQILGAAFDTACRDLHDRGQPAIVYEVIAKRIIDAAKNGEHDPVQLRNAGLTALGFDDDNKEAS